MSSSSASVCASTAKKLAASAWQFYRRIGSPKYIMSPMVNASELPFRMLGRKYGAQLCYTPMIHAKQFIISPKYRRQIFNTCAEDRPLLVQFCANDPDVLLQASKMVENDCDAIDINFGCPQKIAQRGHYGAFLLNESSLMCRLGEYSNHS